MERIVRIGDSDYWVAPKPDVSFELDSRAHQQFIPTEATRLPVCLFDTRTESPVEAKWICEAVIKLENCKTYNNGFRPHIILCQAKSGLIAKLSSDVRVVCRQWNSKVIQVKMSDTLMREGPYYLIGKSLHRVYKLFDDPFGAFVCGVVPDQDDPTKFHKINDRRIPVPSYYYDMFQGGAPLHSLRIAVKDVFDLSGVPTSASSRAYESLYGNAQSNASVVQKLIELGAHVVGKTKTSQFASGESAIDWVDYQCPINPRGDGSFAPNCSSTGSAVATAAYDWLDLCIGTDTLGSIMQPAFANGVFGFRPTQGRFDSTGCLEVSQKLDTIGYFTRVPEPSHRCESFTSVLYGSIHVEGECSAEGGYWAPRERSPTSDETDGMYDEYDSEGEWRAEGINPKIVPSRILYPTEIFAAYAQPKKTVLDGFVNRMLKRFNQPDLKTHFDVERVWKTANEPAPCPALSSLLSKTLAHIQLYDCYENTKVFRDSYRVANGHDPLVNPMIDLKWNLGSKINKSVYDQACEQQSAFRKFLDDKVFTDGTILVLPASPPELAYRNDDFTRTFGERGHSLQGFGFDLHHCSYLGGLPEVVIPVGQVPVKSVATGKETFEPVSIAIIGPRGSDHQLMEMVNFVWKQVYGETAKINTGETAFEASAPPRKRAKTVHEAEAAPELDRPMR